MDANNQPELRDYTPEYDAVDQLLAPRTYGELADELWDATADWLDDDLYLVYGDLTVDEI